HLVAILRMHEDAVALDDAALSQRRRKRRGRGIDLAPGPGLVAPDEALAAAVPARILRQQMGKVHHAARHACKPAVRRSSIAGQLTAHLRPSQTPAASRTIPATPDAIACFM